MSSTAPDTGRSPADRQILVLAAVLFLSYLCVATALPVVPVFVAHGLGASTAMAGLGVGIAFFSTIVTRGWAGGLADRTGAKRATTIGFATYFLGTLICAGAGISGLPVWMALAVLFLGRLIVGLGESLVTVSIIGWGIGLAGPARSGKVMSLVGAALYGAVAVGGPLGLALYHVSGFAGVMILGMLLAAAGLMASRLVPAVPVIEAPEKVPFLKVVGLVRNHGAVVLLQGVGFAAIGAFFSLYFLSQGWPWAGLGLTAFGTGFVIVRFAFGHLPDRIGGLRVAIVSLSVECVGLLLIWAAPVPVLALVGAFMTGLGCSLIYPGMGRDVVHRVPAHLRVTALGAFAAFQDLAYGLTGPLAGLLADRAGYPSVFLACAIAAATGLVISIRMRARDTALA